MSNVILPEKTKTYSVRKIADDILITGKGDDPNWKNGIVLSDFEYPWENKRSTTTSFKALHNADWFYCLFEVHDENIKVCVEKNDKLEVINSDRVEIFFKKDDSLMPYYCLELDPNGRVLDYKAEYYRQFNFEWSWPNGHLVVKASRKAEDYKVEVAFSKESLRSLGVLKENKLEAGLYRADCLSLNGDQATMSWISWMNPKSETPDFHIPSSFGVLILEELR